MQPQTGFDNYYRCNKELNDIYHMIATKLALSDSEFIILYSIVRLGEGCLQKDISELSCISKQTVNSSVKKLEAHSYITLGKGKKRDVPIYLTPIGRQFIEQQIIPITKIEDDAFSEMGSTESQELLRLTQKFITLFQKKTTEHMK